MFNEWIVQACSFWEKNAIRPPSNIGKFTMELLGLISSNEQKFVELNSSNIHLRLIDIVQVKSESTPSIKMAFVKLLSLLLEHKSGFEWIIVKNMWTDVLAFCVTNPTVHIVRESSNFIYKLLQKAAEYDTQFLNSVIQKIMQPFTMIELKSANNVDEEQVKDKLTPTLRLISFIMEQYCKNDCSQRNSDLVLTLFLQNYHLKQIISTYMVIAKSEDFTFELENITLLIYFTELCAEVKEPTFRVEEQLSSLSMKVFKLLAANISKHYNLNVIKLSHLCIRYMSFIKSIFPLQVGNSQEYSVIFESKIIIFQILPICLISESICSLTSSHIDFDEFRDNYFEKIFKLMCTYTIRVGYGWRNQLMTEDNCFEISFEALLYSMQSRQYYTKEMGVMAFQAIIYGINDLVNTMKDSQHLIDACMKRSNYMCTIFNAVGKMIEDFQITWRDCVETICVMCATIDFINLTRWPPEVSIVQF